MIMVQSIICFVEEKCAESSGNETKEIAIKKKIFIYYNRCV